MATRLTQAAIEVLVPTGGAAGWDFRASRPARIAAAPGWADNLIAAHPLRGWGTAYDASRLRRDATLTGSAAWSRGPYGDQVVTGNASSGGAAQVTFARPAELVGATAGTVAVLARLDSLANSSGGTGVCNLASFEDRLATTVVYRLNYNSSTGGMYWQPGPDNTYQVGGFGPPDLGTWVVFVGRLLPVSSTAGEVSLWYGARKVGATTFTGAAFGNDGAAGGAAFGGSGAFTNREWNGAIAAHYLWSRALTDAEIVALAADPFAPVRPRLRPVNLSYSAPAGRFRRIGMDGGFLSSYTGGFF